MLNAVRRSLLHGSAIRILTALIILRSLLAPGFMVEPDGDSFTGFTISICENIYGVYDMDTTASMSHGHHGSDSGQDHTSDTHHLSTLCDALSLSTAFLDIQHSHNDLYLIAVITILPIDDSSLSLLNPIHSRQQARAPPETSLIQS
jgi:hypothetical protein